MLLVEVLTTFKTKLRTRFKTNQNDSLIFFGIREKDSKQYLVVAKPVKDSKQIPVAYIPIIGYSFKDSKIQNRIYAFDANEYPEVMLGRVTLDLSHNDLNSTLCYVISDGQTDSLSTCIDLYTYDTELNVLVREQNVLDSTDIESYDECIRALGGSKV